MDLPLWNHPGFESVDGLMVVIGVLTAALLVNPIF